MRRDLDRNQYVAGRAAAGRGHALPPQPDLLAVLDSGRNLELDLFADRQVEPARAAMRGLVQGDGRRRGHVLAAQGRANVFGLKACARPTTPAHAEHLAQDVLEARAACTAAA